MKEIKSKIEAIDRRYSHFMDEIKLPVNNELAHRQPATFETNFYNNVEINLKKLLKIFNYIYNF